MYLTISNYIICNGLLVLDFWAALLVMLTRIFYHQGKVMFLTLYLPAIIFLSTPIILRKVLTCSMLVIVLYCGGRREFKDKATQQTVHISHLFDNRH